MDTVGEYSRREKSTAVEVRQPFSYTDTLNSREARAGASVTLPAALRAEGTHILYSHIDWRADPKLPNRIGQPVSESVQNSELWASDLGVFFQLAACFLSSIRARLARVAVPRAAARVATRYSTLQQHDGACRLVG
jgi:hypothetical protein